MPETPPHRPAAVLGPIVAATAMALLVPASAWAQDLPADPAGALLQEHRRRIDEMTPAPSAVVPAPVPAQRPVAPDTRGRVSVAEIQFSPSALLPEAALRAVAQSYVGRALGTADIQALLDEVSALYRERGVLTAVPVLPPQDLRSGVLRILLVEGRLGQVVVKTPGLANPFWVQAWFDLPLNQVITEQALADKLQRFNLSSDFTAEAAFVPGERFGVSNLQVNIAPSEQVQHWALYEGSTQGQNQGMGQWAVGMRISPATSVGGRLDTALVYSRAGSTVTGAFSVPIDTSGWRLGVSGSVARSVTRVPASNERPDLKLVGRASALSWDLNKTWPLANAWQLGTSLSVGQQDSRTALDDNMTLLGYRAQRVGLSASLSQDSERQRTALRVSLSSSDERSRISDDRNRSQFWEVQGSWTNAFDRQGRWLGKVGVLWRGEASGTPGTAERFQLGGNDTVRGFDSGAASGTSGAAVQLEARHRLNEGPFLLQSEAYAFLDVGQAEDNGQRNTLRALGWGWQARLNARAGLDLVWARGLRGAERQPPRTTLRLVMGW